MKQCTFFLTLSVLGLFLVGCGMSDEEKERIAKVTCAEIKETRGMDSAPRVKRVNEAREKLRLEPFLDGDDWIVRSVKKGTCEQLVLNDPIYKALTEYFLKVDVTKTSDSTIKAMVVSNLPNGSLILLGASRIHSRKDRPGTDFSGEIFSRALSLKNGKLEVEFEVSDGWWLEELAKYGIDKIEPSVNVRAMFTTMNKAQPLAVLEILGSRGEYIGGTQVEGVILKDRDGSPLGRVLSDEKSVEFPLRPESNIFPYGQE